MIDQRHADIQAACAGLVSAFAYLVDHRRYDELVALFTEDCVFERPGACLHGRHELFSFMQARTAETVSRHICTAPFIDKIHGNIASGTSYLVFCEGESTEAKAGRLTGVTAIAEYQDEFCLTADGWRIQIRKVVPILVR